MTPVLMRNQHDPANDSYGDCHRAAVATVLDLPLDAVPHFAEGGPSGHEFKRREREFFASKGLVPIDLVFKPPEECGHGLIMHVVGDLNPGLPYILAGTDAAGGQHSVVCLNDEVYHDPNPQKPGIVGPCADGWYWITFFGALSLDRRPLCGLCGCAMAPTRPGPSFTTCTRKACANAD